VLVGGIRVEAGFQRRFVPPIPAPGVQVQNLGDLLVGIGDFRRFGEVGYLCGQVLVLAALGWSGQGGHSGCTRDAKGEGGQ